MDNKDYNDYLTKLFMDCSLKAYEFEHNGNSYMASPDKMFRETASAFNKSIASGFLRELSLNYPNIEAKVNNYPERFWHTSEAKDAIREGFNNLIKEELTPKIQSLYESYYQSDNIGLNSEKQRKVDEKITELNEQISKSVKSILKTMEYAAGKLEVLNPENHAFNIIADNIINIVSPIAQIQREFGKNIDVSVVTNCLKENTEFNRAVLHMINSFIEDEFTNPQKPTRRM